MATVSGIAGGWSLLVSARLSLMGGRYRDSQRFRI
jgi:hypothetical protein